MTPVIGQECCVPKYGIGRVVSFEDNFPFKRITVRPYINGTDMIFDWHNVTLMMGGRIQTEENK